MALVPSASRDATYVGLSGGIYEVGLSNDRHVLLLVWTNEPVFAQTSGGTLRVYHRDSPASMSIYEETTISTLIPIMGVFNNLVVFDPEQAENKLENIIPGLSENWLSSDDGKSLIFNLRRDVRWHDGRPFTAQDVKCSWDLLLNRAKDKLRLNARESWWVNLNEVTADEEFQVTFHLKRPQPSFLTLLASGLTPVYQCHVSPSDMRQHPIGTGPFRFVEFKPNQSIKITRNPNYWKPGKPHLDNIE